MADMKAPPDPRPARAAAPAPTQDELVDLAASSFRPTVHPVLAGLEQARRTLAELQAPVVETLRASLKHLHEVRSLGSAAENAQAAATVYRLAKSCEMDLTYRGEPVALSFQEGRGYRMGVFSLRTFGGKPKRVYDKTNFPPLELTAISSKRR